MGSGVALAGLAEGMALADRAGLQQKDILEVLQLTGLACPLMVEEGKAIIEGVFPTSHPLKHIQKDLKLSLNMGDQLDQPLPLTASANEVFKHAKRLGYGDRYKCGLHSSPILDTAALVSSMFSILPYPVACPAFCIYTKLLLKEKKFNAPYTTDESPT